MLFTSIELFTLKTMCTAFCFINHVILVHMKGNIFTFVVIYGFSVHRFCGLFQGEMIRKGIGDFEDTKKIEGV